MLKNHSVKLILQSLISMILLLAFSSAVYAAYLENVPVSVTQPNGDILNCLASGDEFFNYLHDEEGNIIIQHPANGYYTYAQLNDEGKVIASSQIAANNGSAYVINNAHSFPLAVAGARIQLNDIDFSLNKQLIHRQSEPQTEQLPAPLPETAADIGIVGKTIQGNMENVIIMICFADEDPTITPLIKDKIESAFNGPTLSLSHYMQTVSEGVLKLHSTLVGRNSNTLLMYQDDKPRKYYQPYNEVTNPNGYKSETESTTRERTLLSIAVTALDGSALLSGKNLDIEGDNYVDSLTFIVSGSPDGWDDLLWPHQWYFASAYSAYLNGKRVDDFSFQLVDDLFPAYGNADVGTICHEALHVFGMPDLYRYTKNGTPVGYWDIMSTNTMTPQLPNSHLRLRYAGWGKKLTEITANGHYTLYPIGSSSGTTAYAIATSSAREFILLEYRSENNGSGYDTYFGNNNSYSRGLTIARINTAYYGNANRSGQTNDEVYVYRLNETALNQGNGSVSTASLSADKNRVSFGNKTVTNGYSDTIYLYDGANTQYIISNVSAAGQTISFDVALSPSFSGQILYQTSTRPATVELYNNSGEKIQTVITNPDGSYSLSAIAGSGYTLTVTKPGYLSHTSKNLTLSEGKSLPTIDIRQIAGDIDGNGVVNATDLTYLLSEFNRNPLNSAYPYADIDGNGVVNATDLTYLLAGFNKHNTEIINN